MKMEGRKEIHSKYRMIILAVLLVANVILAGLLGKSISEKRRLEAQLLANKDVVEHTLEEIDITLPETVYVAEGITIEIYNCQVTNLGEDITKYNILWKCDVGENLERKFSITADETSLGAYELSLEIYDNQLQLVAKKNCTLEIVEENATKKELASSVSKLSEIPAECFPQVELCVDKAYNGILEELKPEGQKQMQDVVYSVLCGL